MKHHISPDREQLQYWTDRIAVFSDQSAYESLFLHLYDFLLACAYAIVKNKEIAEELVIDTFVNLWRSRERLSEVNNVQVYTYVSVKNLSLKSVAHQKHRREVNWDELTGEGEVTCTPSPEELLISNETVTQIEQAIESLPPKCKVILRWCARTALSTRRLPRY